jgi:hypothetical protein
VEREKLIKGQGERERESGRKNKFMILLLVEKWKGERIFSNNRE